MSDEKPNILGHLNMIPPFMVIAMARRNRKRMTYEEIAKATKDDHTLVNVSAKTIERLANFNSWARVKVGVMHAVCVVTNTDVMNQRDPHQYIRQTLEADTPFAHLTHREREQLFKRLGTWKELRDYAESIKPPEWEEYEQQQREAEAQAKQEQNQQQERETE